MYGLEQEQIEELRNNPAIADILNTDGIVQSTDQSKILSGHFGVVPGVLTEEIARILAGFNDGISLETNYENPLKSDDTIEFNGSKSEPEIYIPGEKKVNILATANVSGRDLVHYEFPEGYNTRDLDTSILDYHLLQSDIFQLASGASMIDSDNYFSGHYRIPENYPFLIEDRLPFSFMKEVVNQIISLSNSITNNPQGVRSGSTILLSSSHIARTASLYPIGAPGGSVIIVSGKAGSDPTNPKRGLIAEYTAHNDERIPLFHGKITGTKVPTKILFKKKS